jgi:PTH1 family peptidyl-tRNA hydrolase
MTLFVGLGNPGSQYENTRHNIGFRVIDKLVDDLDARDISKTSFQGKLYRSANSLFLKPTTFMNLSGKSLQSVKHFYKVELDEIIVIHDDTHITKEYLRVRVGVGKPEHKSQVSDYVLHDFSEEEFKMLDRLIVHVAEACKVLVTRELNEIKSKYSLKSIEGLSV